MSKKVQSITRLIIGILCLFVIGGKVRGQNFDWVTLPPTEPAKIWKINNSRQLEQFVQPDQMAPFNETKRIAVVIESIVINDKRDLFSGDAEVAIISRLGEGGVASDPMLVSLAQVSEGKAAVIKVPVTGPRYWTGVNSYDLRLEMWEIDDEKMSAMLAGQRLQYGQVKQQLRAITGSLTSAAVTPHEAAITALLQPILMAIALQIEKPDKLFRSRVELTTTPQQGGTAVLPLLPGRYVLEYQIPGRTRRVLAAGMGLNEDFSLTQKPSGSGSISNYMVLRIDVVDADGDQPEQDARKKIGEFRNSIRAQAGDLLPQMIRNLVPATAAPIDQIVGQLELNDLKKRYEIRRSRVADGEKIAALGWFIDQVRDGRVPISVNNTDPLFTVNQLRDAINFVSVLVTNAKPVLDTDDPDEVLKAWRGLIKSASAAQDRPSRTFSVDGSRFKLEKGLDEWYFENKLTPALRAAVSTQPLTIESVTQTKKALKDYLETIEITDPEIRLTADEKTRVINKFRSLFERVGAQLPEVLPNASASAQAQVYSEWLKDNNLFVEAVATNEQPPVVRAGNWVNALLSHTDNKLVTLTGNSDGSTAIAGLFNDVIRPLLQAMDSSEGPFATPEAKQKLANWLKDHTDANLGTDVSAWRKYFADYQNNLASSDVAGKITITRMDAFHNRLRVVKGVINGLLADVRQNPDFELRGAQLRARLQPITNILQATPTTLTPQQETKIFSLFEALGTPLTSKAQYLELVNENLNGTFLVTFRAGELVSGRPGYFSGPSIIADLQNFVAMNATDRDWQLRRAIAFITSEAGSSDQASRQTILDLLTGPQGLTDFNLSENRFNASAWREWFVELKPIWHAEVRRYIRSAQSPIA